MTEQPVAGSKVAIWRKKCPECGAGTKGIVSGGSNPDLWTCENGHRAEVEWVSSLLGHCEPILHMLA